MDQCRPPVGAIQPVREMSTEPPSVTVIIPTLNEAKNLPHVFSRLPDGPLEVIVVDGGSVDDTVAVAKESRPDVLVVNQSRTGKGNALACGMLAASGDIIVLLDADGSTDPAEIPSFVAALVAGADYVKGSRVLPGGGSHDLTAWRGFGNACLTWVMNTLFGTDFTDSCYGYNSLWRRHLDVFGLDITPSAPGEVERRWGDGFEIEVLLHARAAGGGLRIGEVPSVERNRLFGDSNLHAIRDGMRILRTIVREFRGSRVRSKAHQERRVVEFKTNYPGAAKCDPVNLVEQYAKGEAK
jgi:glycosyltransferase involved in cell wall biosynthesis